MIAKIFGVLLMLALLMLAYTYFCGPKAEKGTAAKVISVFLMLGMAVLGYIIGRATTEKEGDPPVTFTHDEVVDIVDGLAIAAHEWPDRSGDVSEIYSLDVLAYLQSDPSSWVSGDISAFPDVEAGLYLGIAGDQ